ncbi:multiubiquitin domain-containing protein [Methylophilus flavus]|uniref:Multiubiquitin domain-containing protein n=1 Tax=Methylophilus flavus TaxID=640084 RepID=A0ABW3P8A3_9PROT
MSNLNDPNVPKPKGHPIFIDGTKYTVEADQLTGAQLRALVPVPDNRDLWLEVHGPKDDILIRPEKEYEIKPGSQFYTAPSTINPGGI